AGRSDRRGWISNRSPRLRKDLTDDIDHPCQRLRRVVPPPPERECEGVPTFGEGNIANSVDADVIRGRDDDGQTDLRSHQRQETVRVRRLLDDVGEETGLVGQAHHHLPHLRTVGRGIGDERLAGQLGDADRLTTGELVSGGHGDHHALLTDDVDLDTGRRRGTDDGEIDLSITYSVGRLSAVHLRAQVEADPRVPLADLPGQTGEDRIAARAAEAD